jgi:hypothetical protein
MRQVHARLEQPQSIPSIVAAALRAAALSDHPNDAIDVLGVALLHLAELTREAEVRHV